MDCLRTTALGVALLLLVGCEAEKSQTPGERVFEISSVEPDTVLPGTWILIRGENFPDETVGTLSAILKSSADSEWSMGPERVDDKLIKFRITPAIFEKLGGEGIVACEVTVRLEMLDKSAYSETKQVKWTLARTLKPVLKSVRFPNGDSRLYLGSSVEASGKGFLLEGEGRTEVRLEGTFIPDGEDKGVDIDKAPITVAASSREQGSQAWPAEALGVRPGNFLGRAIPVNIHENGEEVVGQGLDKVVVQLGPTALLTVEPTRASRGQWIDIYGRGFASGSVAVTVRLEGTFTRKDGTSKDLTGRDALYIAPEVKSGDHMRYVLRVNRTENPGEFTGLGAAQGVLKAKATPEILYKGEVYDGLPLPMEFQFTVLSPKQVVRIDYLPGFSDTIREFGLRNVEYLLRDRVLEVAQAAYKGVNLEFREESPADFADYAVIEVGGEDPNGQGLLGLDASEGKDIGNFYFDDVVGGFNADTLASGHYAFGGVFVASFQAFSPSLPEPAPIASSAFDTIFSPFMPALDGTPVEANEYPGGLRDKKIALAIHALGSMVGETVAHEIGHTLGLAAGPEDFLHNYPPMENQLMDGGADRPFEERAQINHKGPSRFNEPDAWYLQEILPVD